MAYSIDRSQDLYNQPDVPDDQGPGTEYNSMNDAFEYFSVHPTQDAPDSNLQEMTDSEYATWIREQEEQQEIEAWMAEQQLVVRDVALAKALQEQELRQETEDRILAGRLQDQEKEDTPSRMKIREERDRELAGQLQGDATLKRMTQEEKDMEFAKALQEKEQAKVRKAKEKAKQKALLKKQQSKIPPEPPETAVGKTIKPRLPEPGADDKPIFRPEPITDNKPTFRSFGHIVMEETYSQVHRQVLTNEQAQGVSPNESTITEIFEPHLEVLDPTYVEPCRYNANLKAGRRPSPIFIPPRPTSPPDDDPDRPDYIQHTPIKRNASSSPRPSVSPDFLSSHPGRERSTTPDINSSSSAPALPSPQRRIGSSASPTSTLSGSRTTLIGSTTSGSRTTLTGSTTTLSSCGEVRLRSPKREGGASLPSSPVIEGYPAPPYMPLQGITGLEKGRKGKTNRIKRGVKDGCLQQ